MFIVDKGLPYYISEDYKKMYPCEIDAFSYSVDFSKPISVLLIDCVLTDNEVRAKLGIVAVDGWDKANNKIVKVSNKTVSSKSNSTTNTATKTSMR